ncbi:hypothetical protein B620_gp31 [Croceibacter phage P2559S]|uniref:hypothetical protein n=1 Tax=Croceibacter phage P2559S TaxID=1176422 RepID=UPI0002688EBA|nr:hypothetical protein B620_gp31 [Croceibacter phage P2559S]AFM54809.1 hypothetical protein P2559S_31 [Croceibacter phage P2559S]
METSIYTGLKFTTSEVNQNFKIKAHTTNKSGKNLNTLLGVSGLIKLVGVEFANKFIERAFNSGQDKHTSKLRSGVRVTFYSH